jgi:hypothetical protein
MTTFDTDTPSHHATYLYLNLNLNVPHGLLDFRHHVRETVSEASGHGRDLLLVALLVDEQRIDEVPEGARGREGWEECGTEYRQMEIL